MGEQLFHFLKSPRNGYWVIDSPIFVELGVKTEKAAMKWARRNGYKITLSGTRFFLAKKVNQISGIEDAHKTL